jgi:hypothetical protein
MASTYNQPTTQSDDLKTIAWKETEMWNEIVAKYGNNIPEVLRMNHERVQSRLRTYMGRKYNEEQGNCKHSPWWCTYRSSMYDSVCKECIDGSKYMADREWEYF